MEFTQGVRFDSLGLTEEVQRALKKKNIEDIDYILPFMKCLGVSEGQVMKNYPTF